MVRLVTKLTKTLGDGRHMTSRPSTWAMRHANGIPSSLLLEDRVVSDAHIHRFRLIKAPHMRFHQLQWFVHISIVPVRDSMAAYADFSTHPLSLQRSIDSYRVPAAGGESFHTPPIRISMAPLERSFRWLPLAA